MIAGKGAKGDPGPVDLAAIAAIEARPKRR